MDKQQLIDKLKNKNYSHEQLLGWVNALPGGKAISMKPTKYRKGDVLMHPIFAHPYILLDKKEDGTWICGMLTSESTCPEILEKCRSRFYPESYFTKMLFTTKVPLGSTYPVYDNPKHRIAVIKKLKEILS